MARILRLSLRIAVHRRHGALRQALILLERSSHGARADWPGICGRGNGKDICLTPLIVLPLLLAISFTRRHVLNVVSTVRKALSVE